MAEWRMTFEVELLEDLHSGTGAGWMGLIDDAQARAADGRPVVRASSLIGRLREAAELLCAAGHPLASHGRIQSMFGVEGAARGGRVVGRSLRLDARAGHRGPAVVEVTRTAREAHSRRALDETRRRIECAAAGLVSRGEVRLLPAIDGSRTDEQEASADRLLLELCLRRVTSLGAGRSRGMGQVRISPSPVKRLEPDGSRPLQLHPGRLRVLFRTLEPVCIAKTGTPGNIIPTEMHVPGRTLRGAWLTAMRRAGASEAAISQVANGCLVQFCDALPVPARLVPAEGEARRRFMTSTRVTPLPLSARERKSADVGERRDVGPWWIRGGEDLVPWHGREGMQLDSLRSGSGSDLSGYKRIRSEDVLVELRDKEGQEREALPFVLRWTPESVLIMRNRVPVARMQRKFDSRRPKASPADLDAEEGDLFTIEALPEDTWLLGEVVIASQEAAGAFSQGAVPFVSGAVEDRWWLRIGRSGAPAVVEAICDVGAVRAVQPLDTCALTLTSSLVARTADLRFSPELDEGIIAGLLNMPEAARELSIEHSVQGSQPVSGFSAAAGGRRPMAMAVARGSAILLRASGDLGRAALKRLAEIEATGGGLGERVEEGCGRFVLEHSAHATGATGVPLTGPPESSVPPAIADPVAERAAGRAMKFYRDEVERHPTRHLPSRSQWQALRHDLDRGTDDGTLSVIEGVRDHSQTLGGRHWDFRPSTGGEPLIVRVLIQAREIRDKRERRLFVIALCRHAVACLSSRRTRQGEPQ